MKRIQYPAALVALLAICFGCRSTATSGIEGSSTVMLDADGGTQYSEYVVVNNPRVARGLQIVDLDQQFVGDILRAQVTLASKYSRTRNYKYRFSWFDETGVELDAGARHWLPLLIHGYETRTLQGVAPNPSARQFKINIRAR